jgi:serine phosphatase RsbU (regulator of sigma subunit)
MEDDFGATLFIGKQAAEPDLPRDAIGHYLLMLEGSEPGRRVEIGTDPMTIGRDARNTLAFTDPKLSRRHAQVSLVNDQAIVEDLASTNGTFVQGERIAGPSTLVEGSVLRLGGQIFRYERQSRAEIEKAEALARELRKASKYVSSLLPAPLTTGPVLADWQFIPSSQLGGDAFGYHWLDADTFAFYLVDVSGHGVGSAVHSVTVLNLLQKRALPGVDFTDPVSVLSRLNGMFQMDVHGGLFFTAWYGVLRLSDRSLVSGSAGHHAAYLATAGSNELQAIGAPALPIGITPDSEYEVQRTTVPPQSRLYLFSDGVFEIVTKDDARWELSNLLPLLLDTGASGPSPAERVYAAVKDVAREGPFDDDFSLMALTIA